MTQDISSQVFDQMVDHLIKRPVEACAYASFSFGAKGVCACCNLQGIAASRVEDCAKRAQALGTQVQSMATELLAAATEQLRAGAQAVLDATDPEKKSKTKSTQTENKGDGEPQA